MNKEVRTISLEELLKGYYSKDKKEETKIFTKIMPQKGDLIKFDLGSPLIDPKEQFVNEYRVLKMEGDTAYVVSMYNLKTMKFGETQDYFESDIDEYLQNKFYNSISEKVKKAIKCQDIIQYSFKLTNRCDERKYASYASKKPVEGVYGRRYIALLEYRDILEYFNNKFSSEDITKLFFKDEEHAVFNSFWLRSASADCSSYCWYVGGVSCCINDGRCSDDYKSRPAFKIDLSEIQFEIIDEIQ